jgi:hypothetical protein
MAVLLGLLCASIGGLLIFSWFLVRSMSALAATEAVAEVRCYERDRRNKTFEMAWQPMVNGQPGPIRRFPLHGDQWEISGGFVKWHPILTAFGFKSYHKPMRISGRYYRVADERASRRAVVSLDEEFDQVWDWFYRMDRFLPFVDGVYGSAAFVPVEDGVVFLVKASPSGYLIERRWK